MRLSELLMQLFTRGINASVRVYLCTRYVYDVATESIWCDFELAPCAIDIASIPCNCSVSLCVMTTDTLYQSHRTGSELDLTEITLIRSPDPPGYWTLSNIIPRKFWWWWYLTARSFKKTTFNSLIDSNAESTRKTFPTSTCPTFGSISAQTLGLTREQTQH